MSALLELAARCEAATGPDRELDAIIWATLDGYTAIEERNGWIVATGMGTMERSLGLIDPGQHSRNFTPQHHDTPQFTASLDAAMTLADGMGVGGEVTFFKDGTAKAFLWQPYPMAIEAKAATPALALCAAALRARAATRQGDAQS